MSIEQNKPVARPANHYQPLQFRRVFVRLFAGGLLLALALSLIGWTIVRLAPASLTRWEDSVNQWFAEGRTPMLDTLSHIGSSLSDTVTCIALLVVAVVVLRVWLRRWRESWTATAAIVGELLVFLIVTAVVNRPRPSVPLLDVAPPTSSFPSGHTAAAVALYGCLAVVVLRQLRPRWFSVTLATVMWIVPIIVGVSRLYRGMHHPTDVLFGAIGGALWLALVLSTLVPRNRGMFGVEAHPAAQSAASAPKG